MSDLIRTKDVLAIIDNRTVKGKLQVAREVLKLPTIEPEPKWIPVSERLPKKSGNYIITQKVVRHDSQYHYLSDVGYFDIVTGWYSKRGLNLKDVIAWMPLPEPYREEGEK